MTSADEGLTCISELIYNQNEVSPRLWGFFQHIITIYVEDRGIIDEVAQASVPLINYMVKAPQTFKQAVNGVSPLDMVLQFIAKVFEEGTELNKELTSMCGVSLIMALLEHLGQESPEVLQHIHTINQFYLTGLSDAETPEYKNMIV